MILTMVAFVLVETATIISVGFTAREMLRKDSANILPITTLSNMGYFAANAFFSPPPVNSCVVYLTPPTLRVVWSCMVRFFIIPNHHLLFQHIFRLPSIYLRCWWLYSMHWVVHERGTCLYSKSSVGMGYGFSSWAKHLFSPSYPSVKERLPFFSLSVVRPVSCLLSRT